VSRPPKSTRAPANMPWARFSITTRINFANRGLNGGDTFKSIEHQRIHSLKSSNSKPGRRACTLEFDVSSCNPVGLPERSCGLRGYCVRADSGPLEWISMPSLVPAGPKKSGACFRSMNAICCQEFSPERDRADHESTACRERIPSGWILIGARRRDSGRRAVPPSLALESGARRHTDVTICGRRRVGSPVYRG